MVADAATGGSFDWCGFCALWYNDKGLRCKINIVDTVLFRQGQLSAWWATNKEGYIQRHTSQTTTLEAIRRRFLAVANDDDSNYSNYVCILRRGDSRPQLLRTQAFNQLCEQLSDALESGRRGAIAERDIPDVMQAFVQPFMDLRYIATFINQGRDSVVHTFQRKYSRRYTALAADPASSAVDLGDNDILNAAAGGLAAVDKTVEAFEQRLEGPVDATLKVKFRKLMVHLVKYIEKAHGLTLAGLVCEFIRDAGGRIYLLSVMRAEWASNARGHGAGSLSALALTCDPLDLEEPTDADMAPHDDGELTRSPGFSPSAAGARPTSALGPAIRPFSAASYGSLTPGGVRPISATSYTALSVGNQSLNSNMSALESPAARPKSAMSTSRSPHTSPSNLRPASSGPGSSMVPNDARRSALIQYPGTTTSRNVTNPLALTNSWPSQQHEAALGNDTRPTSAITHSELSRPPVFRDQSPQYNVQYGGSEGGGGRATAVLVEAAAEASGNPHQRIYPWGEPRSKSTGAVSFGKAVPPAPVHKPLYPERPASGASATGHVNSGPRGAPLIMSQVQQELENLKDQLLYQHSLSEASAAKVRQLEAEKEAAVEAFNRRVGDLQGQLNDTREELETTQRERNSLVERLAASEARVTDLEARSSGLGSKLDSERDTVLAAMRDFQEKDAALKRDREQLEAEVLHMAQRLKEEQMAVDALKRQLTQYAEVAARYNRNKGQNAALEEGMEEVLARIQPLFTGQANPEGEQYALQKVLYHHHPDLRSVFMYYAQLSKEFAKHWPPRMTHVQWMLFCRDSESSDPRSGARIRSGANHRMLSPSACEEVFKEYAQNDEDAADPRLMVLSYESFLAAIVHLAYKVRRPEVIFISEATREYIARYLAKAGRVRPAGIQKGMVRMALEGIHKVSKKHDAARPQTAPSSSGSAMVRTSSSPEQLAMGGRPLSYTARVTTSVPTAEPRSRVVTPRTRWGAKPVTSVPGDDKSPEAIMAELHSLGIPLNM